MGPSRRRIKDGRSDYEKAMEYFSEEDIKCYSEKDCEAIGKIYKVFTDGTHRLFFDDPLANELDSLDILIHNMGKTVVLQNFMLMRKVDSLMARIDELEKKIDNNK